MGGCNDNMKTTKTNASGSVLGNILPRRKEADKKPSADTYADNIEKADKKLSELIALKTADLSKEKGSEVANSLKLGNLKNQQMHIDAIINLMNDYVEIK